MTHTETLQELRMTLSSLLMNKKPETVQRRSQIDALKRDIKRITDAGEAR